MKDLERSAVGDTVLHMVSSHWSGAKSGVESHAVPGHEIVFDDNPRRNVVFPPLRRLPQTLSSQQGASLSAYTSFRS